MSETVDWSGSGMKSDIAISHVIPGEHFYDGLCYPGVYPAHILDRVKTFQFQDDDTILVTYPKSGTTWMSAIMQELALATDSKQKERLQYIEMAFPGRPQGFDAVSNLPSPRTFKSHLIVDFFKRPLAQNKTKFVVVMRNVKDALVSYYHFSRANPALGKFKGSFEDFFEMVKVKRVRDWFGWIEGWWQYKDQPNVHFVKYEDMKKDLPSEIRRLTSFLGISVSDDVISNVCQQTSFSYMSAALANDPLMSRAADAKISPFLRKGIVGDWQEYFTEEMNGYIDHLYRERISRNGLEFEFQ